MHLNSSCKKNEQDLNMSGVSTERPQSIRRAIAQSGKMKLVWFLWLAGASVLFLLPRERQASIGGAVLRVSLYSPLNNFQQKWHLDRLFERMAIYNSSECMSQVANTRPSRAEPSPPPCFIRPGTLFLPGGSAELSLDC